MDSSAKLSRVLAYFGAPALFCALGYLLLFLLVRPVWAQASAYAGLIIAQDAPNFSSKLTSTYDPDALKATITEAGYIDSRSLHYPEAGEQYGQMTCEQMGLDVPVYWHDSDEILAYGAGTSFVSMPPGYGMPIIISGHNMTHFNCLQNAAVGQVIRFHTNWCDYAYQITKVQVYNEDELEKYLLDVCYTQQREELILYCCHPFYATVGRKTDRLVAFADRIEGTNVKWKDFDDE